MKSVIIYTYFSSTSSDYNLKFFVKYELSYKEDIDYIIVINGYYHQNIVFPTLDNLFLIKRDNIGYDFGGHNCALEYIKTNLKSYDYYFFMNSGVFGPILPHYLSEYHWSNIFIKKINKSIKLVGTTIVCLPHTDAGGYGPKVEGFFFMVDNIGLELLINQKNIFCNHPDKYSAIVNGEYGLSNCILKHGYSIDCMLPKYQNIDWRNINYYNLNDNKHPSRKNSFYGMSINPYDVIFHKWFWHGENTVNFDIVEQYVNGLKNIKKYKHKNIIYNNMNYLCKTTQNIIDTNNFDKNYLRNKTINYIKTDNCIGHSIKNGIYWEEWMFAYIKKNYVENTNIVDLGGNIGTTTLLMSEVLSNKCKIYTFEPIYSDILLKNILDNNLSDKIDLYPYGAGNKFETLNITNQDLSIVQNFGALSLREHIADNNNMFKIKIDIVPIDYFNFENVSLMKIDVENMEIEVLEGCLHLIKRCKPTILIETHQVNEFRQSNVFKELVTLGYELSVIPEGHNDFMLQTTK